MPRPCLANRERERAREKEGADEGEGEGVDRFLRACLGPAQLVERERDPEKERKQQRERVKELTGFSGLASALLG